MKTLTEYQAELADLDKAREYYLRKMLVLDRRMENIDRALESPVWLRVLNHAPASARRERKSTQKERRETGREYDRLNKEIWKTRQAQEKLDADKQLAMF